MYFILVVVLNAKHKTEVACLLLTVLPQQMDQIIEHDRIERLDVLDYP